MPILFQDVKQCCAWPALKASHPGTEATPQPLTLGEIQAGPERVDQPMIPLALTGFSRAPGFASPLGDGQGMKGRDKHRRLGDMRLKDTGLGSASRL